MLENKDGIIATSSGEGTITPEFPGNSTDRIIYTSSADFGNHFDNWERIARQADEGVTFEKFLDYYNLDISLIPTDGTSNEMGKVRYYNTIRESGNATDFKIEEGYITYAKIVEISGCGNSGKVTIDGVLITDSLVITGNCPFTLNGGIITKIFQYQEVNIKLSLLVGMDLMKMAGPEDMYQIHQYTEQ